VTGRIEDYAVVGDMQSVALVSVDGSVDWLCLPRFDSEACFAALLGTWGHGCWQIAPKDELESPGVAAASRRYAGEMLILQTRWETPGGVAEVTDFMPPREDGEPPVLDGSEGAFLACSFWLANALELSGRHEEAVELFERLLALRNDVGLLSEEYDPRYGRLVGNMPQAFSHVPLVQTALNLEGHAEEHRRGPWDERRSVPG
jgi:GH15 family glucan-1,4-alpha-glucosidase